MHAQKQLKLLVSKVTICPVLWTFMKQNALSTIFWSLFKTTDTESLSKLRLGLVTLQFLVQMVFFQSSIFVKYFYHFWTVFILKALSKLSILTFLFALIFFTNSRVTFQKSRFVPIIICFTQFFVSPLFLMFYWQDMTFKFSF